MSRNRYLITYDISDDARRTRVFRALEAEGDHVQYSVFVCELNQRERIQLEHLVTEMIQHEEDQVLLVNLGPSRRQPDSFLTTLGRPYCPPGPVVVV